jgi:hypothetical protein
MKVFAIGTANPQFSPESAAQYMPAEVPATLQLYLDGKMEQFWFRTDRPGVVFLMEANSIEEAREEIRALPLASAGLLTFEYLPVGPLAPLGMLLQGK